MNEPGIQGMADGDGGLPEMGGDGWMMSTKGAPCQAVNDAAVEQEVQLMAIDGVRWQSKAVDGGAVEAAKGNPEELGHGARRDSSVALRLNPRTCQGLPCSVSSR